MDHLAARLLQWREGVERPAHLETGLLTKLAPSSGQWIITFFKLALGNGPGTIILVRPIRAARVDKEHLKITVANSIQDYTRAAIRVHRCIVVTFPPILHPAVNCKSHLEERAARHRT